jgi:cation diffusion facilitator CzcD-associated flavoprotein CzcO
MMNAETPTTADADAILREWVDCFGAYIVDRDAAAAACLFAEDGHWKDILAFTWQHKFFAGREEIAAALDVTFAVAGARNFRIAEGRSPALETRRARRAVVEGFFDFDTDAGPCSAFVRLLVAPDGARAPLAWIVLTTLQGLHGFEEAIGRRRPTGDDYAMNVHGRSWLDDRRHQTAFDDRDPDVLVVGAGHAGLVAAARLKLLGVETLVVDKSPRVGDVWRNRYHSLTLHNEISANHLPYMPFPENWPLWLSKDQLGLWLEAYAECMELDVWTATTFVGGEWSESDRRWTVRLARGNGKTVEKRCRHLVVATGVSGSIPFRADVKGLPDFEGEVIHSSEYADGAAYRGKNAIVVGTGNSAHDIAQDLLVKGAGSVAMLQRGPTCVISLKPGAAMIYAIYDGKQRTEDIDLLAAAIPYPLLKASYRGITRKAAEMDRDLLDRLNARGFKTYFGSDETGFQMMYMRGEGGYYINVGCSEHIADGSIGVLQTDDMDSFVADGLKMKDGTVFPVDTVVLATGFRNMQENIRALLGDVVAAKVGKVWGFDQDYQMRAMWRRTGQDGLWITGGSLLDSRIFSRFMTLEIKAELEGLLPAMADLPLRAADTGGGGR